MEITTEIKCKLFAQYLGQKWLSPTQKTPLSDLQPSDIDYIFYIKSKHNGSLLILKPLSEISDEDAIEVAKIAMRRHNRHYKQEEISYLIHEISKESENKIFFTEIYLLINNMPHYVVRLEKNDVCTSELRTKERGGFFAEKDYFTPNTFEIYQYLISKGYDLPHILLGGKTLKESGLAIYKN